MSLPDPTPNSTCLVTGASSGIGREFAREFASRGYGVTLAARRQERLDRLAEEISAEYKVRAEAVATDLADEESRRSLVGRVSDLGLRVDLLVNNAGFGTNGRFIELDRDREIEELRLNCEAVVDLSRTFLPGMVERNNGGVINIASVGAYQPVPYMATYAATKAFVLSFSEALHSELSGTDVTVTAVCPGPVPTEFSSVAGNEYSFEVLPNFALVQPEDIASKSVKAFEKGRRTIDPGFFNSLQARIARPLPSTLTLPIARKIFGKNV